LRRYAAVIGEIPKELEGTLLRNGPAMVGAVQVESTLDPLLERRLVSTLEPIK
jgi:hypothetical protein